MKNEDSTNENTPNTSLICLNWLKHLRYYRKNPHWVSVVREVNQSQSLASADLSSKNTSESGYFSMSGFNT